MTDRIAMADQGFCFEDSHVIFAVNYQELFEKSNKGIPVATFTIHLLFVTTD